MSGTASSYHRQARRLVQNVSKSTVRMVAKRTNRKDRSDHQLVWEVMCHKLVESAETMIRGSVAARGSGDSSLGYSR
jgi:hypothetical protein